MPEAVPGAGRNPVEPAADRPAAVVEAVPDRQSQQASAHGPANPVEPLEAAVAVALARNPVEPLEAAVVVGTEAVPAAHIPVALAVVPAARIPARPAGAKRRFVASRPVLKHYRT